VFGKVSEINSSAGQITIKTAAGSTIVASVNEKTTYQRMPPGETDRTKAEQTSLTEITVGDGVVARGFVAADKKSVPAQQIIVVSQSEIAKKNQAERMAWAREETAGNSGMLLTLALNYGARSELVDAFNDIVRLAASNGGLGHLKIDEALIDKHLYTRHLPDPDLVVRTSGEMRLSNFLLWQLAYAEIYVTDVLWPDFRGQHLLEAIAEYQKRERRYGGLSAAEQPHQLP